MFNSKFPERLKDIRNKMGMAQKQFSKYVGLSYGTIQNYEYGLTKPSCENLCILCNALNVSADYLLGLVETSSNEKSDIAYKNETIFSICDAFHVFECLSDNNKERVLDYMRVLTENESLNK